MHATCLRCHRTIGTSGRETLAGRGRKFATFHAAIFCVVMLSKGGEQTRRRGGLWWRWWRRKWWLRLWLVHRLHGDDHRSLRVGFVDGR